MAAKNDKLKFEEVDLDEEVNDNAISLDDLNNISIDYDKVEEEEKKLVLPRGDYRKNGIWNIFQNFNDEDQEKDDLFHAKGKGRLFITLSGPIIMQRKGQEYEGYIQISLSPDVRRKRIYDDHGNMTDDTEDKGDRPYKLFIDALRVYEESNEERAKDIPTLLDFLQNEDFVISLIAFRGSNYVSGLKTLRQRR